MIMVWRSEDIPDPDNWGCANKRRYATKKEIMTQINAFNRHSRGRHGRPECLRAYYCDKCGGWHMTKGQR